MNQQLQSVLVERPREVDVLGIERELTQLWRQSAAAGEREQSPVMVRACSMNLIVVTEEEATLNEVSEIVGELTVEHPSRAFLLAADRRQRMPSLDAWVSVRCTLPTAGSSSVEAGNKQVCSEQITLKATGNDLARLSSVIMSLLVPDVPTVLVWKGEVDSRDELLQSLTRISERALIDSSEDPNPERRLKMWGKLFSDAPPSAAFGDLAWKHITPWRSLLADAFQPWEIREHLLSIDSVGIQYSLRASPLHSGLSQSLLLAAWLANALRWTTAVALHRTSGSRYSGTAKDDDHLIRIDVSPVDDALLRPGEIESVSVHSGRGMELLLRSTESRQCVQQVLHADPGPTVETLLPIRLQTETELLSGELEELHPDELYRKSVTALLRMLEDQV